MDQAIKLAIEKGGWRNSGTITEEQLIKFGGGCASYIYHEKDRSWLLDPLFWQALGKALGIRRWQTPAEHYFQIILDSGDTEKFWRELIKPI